MKISDVVDTVPEEGQTTQKHFTEVFRQIGLHFLNNADRLGSSIGEKVASVDIFINLEPDSIVTVDISQKEILVKR